MTWTPPPHDPNVELRDHLDPDGWFAAMRAIAERHALPRSELAPFATGSDIVWGTERSVIKMTAPRWQDEIDAEVRGLDAVSGRLPVAVPSVVASGELAGWPYVVVTRVPGVAIGDVWASLDRAGRTAFARDLGALLGELHAIDVRGLPNDWDAYFADCRANVGARHAEPDVPPDLVAAIDPFLAAIGELQESSHALVHTEVLDQHVLVEPADDGVAIRALIDFADARVGPPEYEFAAPVEFIFRGEPGLLRAFLIAYGVPPSELTADRPRVMLAWALSHRFGRLKRALEAVAPWRPSSLEELAQRLYGLD